MKNRKFLRRIVFTVILTGAAAFLLSSLAAAERGYFAVGGEWLLTAFTAYSIWRLSEYTL